LGPGTDVASRVRHGHKPVDADDRVALHHDIDYLGATGPYDIYVADYKAIKSFDWSLHGTMGKLGLAARMFMPQTTNLFVGNQPQLAEKLRSEIDLSNDSIVSIELSQ